MEKRKLWQGLVIVAALFLTLYNIIPTVIYYMKPLNKNIDEKGSLAIEESICDRLKDLEEDSKEWIVSFSKAIGVTPSSINVDKNDPSIITFDVKNEEEAILIRKFLPQAGALIPFRPSQLFLGNIDGRHIEVIRRLGISTDKKEILQYFRFFEKRTNDGTISDQYYTLVKDRFTEVAFLVGGPSYLRELKDKALNHDKEALEKLASELYEWESASIPNSLYKRLINSLFQGHDQKESLIRNFLSEAKALEEKLSSNKRESSREENELVLRIQRLKKASDFLANAHSFGKTPASKKTIQSWLDTQREKHKNSKGTFTLLLEGRNPFIQSITIDWDEDTLTLSLYDDIQEILKGKTLKEEEARLQETVRKSLLHEISYLSRKTNETFQGNGASYTTEIVSSSNGFLSLGLDKVASKMAKNLIYEINLQWNPTSEDLQSEVFPRYTLEEFQKAPQDMKRLSLLVFSPAMSSQEFKNMKSGSLYVVIKGGQTLYAFRDETSSPLKKDFEDLAQMLQERGFVLYSGEVFGKDSPFAKDWVFELDHFYEPLLTATQESFKVKGLSPFAILELGTVEDRILQENRIDDALQDDLIKQKEAYQAAQVSLNPQDRIFVTKPSKSVFWSNIKRVTRKYFRGDDSKIIRWGLDLSGGKSVRVGLVDNANRPVTKPEDLKQAVSELYTRLNKMGVSERTLRIENGTISIDFPGVQGVTATELIKASAMTFHVVNETFSPYNPELSKFVQGFLQDVWNEALVTDMKDMESLNKIALKRIEAVKNGLAIDDNIKNLLDHGLIIEDPSSTTSSFNDTISMIARYRGDDSSEWARQGHPLLIVFKNFALEGCNLENVQPSYDASKGNILVFGVRGSDSRGLPNNPRDDFYTWTSQFSEENILGTAREKPSHGRGWRMAVILNGSVISAPQLSSPLRDSAMISGNFTQREVQKQATDLQAGSLSFTPKILSEENVSPELGTMERIRGLGAALISFVAVVVIMVGYYRFAGFIASAAVFFNLLIIWAVMQNIEAAMTLPALAGIVLTVAMAVDSNVLIFERTREEFSVTGRIATALSLGYKKSFSAIVDSNLTTLIAAFILTRFDSGPIRGFAMTLIIGLISSMFTSLFVTRYYFAGWSSNPKHTHLTMLNWFKSKDFDFLAWKKPAIIISLALVIAGSIVTAFSWKSMLGMDFTGGYALVVDVEAGNRPPKEVAIKGLIHQGLTPSEIQIRELGRPSLLRIQLAASLEEPGRPFYNLPQSVDVATQYPYQKIPRIQWVVKALEEGGLTIRQDDLPQLSQSWTAISGQFSDTMRNNALMGLSLALLATLIYIAIRFEWKYAISAILALMHDVILTLAVLATLHYFHVPLQINLEVIAAILTIIGYQLNDTIIVFDRIREDLVLYRKKKFSDIVNLALNSTLSRTLMTSGITLIVLLCLVLLGGASIFAFSFVMFTGVLLGTLSSLFVASALLVFFNEKELE